MTLIKPDGPNTNNCDPSTTAIKVRVPKRILHFSDGILEEYSDDEIDNASNDENEQTLIDPSTMTWGPWLWYKTWKAGYGTLAVVDAMGEFLAAFFGITTPKYYFELEEYKRRQEENKEQQEKREGWSEPPMGENVQLNEINTKQPQPTNV